MASPSKLSLLVLMAGVAAGGCGAEVVVLSGAGGDASSSSDSGAGGGPAEPECRDEADCPDGHTCFEGTCVGTGQFRVSLSWTVVSDFDLHVRTPSGAEIYYANPVADGGELDVDDCISGICQDNLGTHVENVFFDETAGHGLYSIWIVNFDGMQAGSFAVEVSGATSGNFSGSLPAQPDAASQTYTVTY